MCSNKHVETCVKVSFLETPMRVTRVKVNVSKNSSCMLLVCRLWPNAILHNAFMDLAKKLLFSIKMCAVWQVVCWLTISKPILRAHLHLIRLFLSTADGQHLCSIPSFCFQGDHTLSIYKGLLSYIANMHHKLELLHVEWWAPSSGYIEILKEQQFIPS